MSLKQIVHLLITISFPSGINGQQSNWIASCQSSAKDLPTVCLNEFNQWIQIFNQHPISPDTTNTSSQQMICPTSLIWKSLVTCACNKCHHTFLIPDDLMVIWTKSQCNMTQFNTTVDLCKWINTSSIIANNSHLSLPELEKKLHKIVEQIQECKTMPTIQNIQTFLHLFNQIIDTIINLHVSSTKPQILKQWQNNVTDTFEAYKQTESRIKSQENALKDGLNTIESKENEMVEDLRILQQLENHFNIPKAQNETQQILKQFKDLLSGIEEIHDKHMMKNHTDTNAKELDIFWSKGVRKLSMAANILSVISNETESIRNKLDSHRLSLNIAKRIGSEIEDDLQDDHHKLLFHKEFHQIVDEMRNLSKSESYQQSISVMEQLSNEWKSSTQKVMINIEMIEMQIINLFEHIQNANASEAFLFNEDTLHDHEKKVTAKPSVNIDDVFKEAWQQEMKLRHVNRSNASLQYDDASIDEPPEDHTSSSVDLMANKTIVYAWAVFVGAIVLCFSFFMYLK